MSGTYIRSEVEEALDLDPAATFEEIGQELGITKVMAQKIYYRALYKFLMGLYELNPDSKCKELAEMIPLYKRGGVVRRRKGK